MSKVYNIPCTWMMYGQVNVEADSLEEAIEKAGGPDVPLPTDGSYIEDSFEVDIDLVLEAYPDENFGTERGW